jgi:hypothetical protein
MMKRILLSLALLLLLSKSGEAKPMTEAAARIVAANYFAHVSGKTVSSITLATVGANADRTLYYAFTIEPNQGYVLVAADDQSTPILGYNVGSGFVVPKDNRVGIKDWLTKYSNEINYIVVHDLKANDAITEAWRESLSGDFTPSQKLAGIAGIANATAVTPLLPCNWDQDPYYDAYCPYDSAAKAQTVTGCPATAMGQIMKKWRYPSIGAGSHSYNTTKYGTLAANFGGTTYNWSSMADSLSAPDSNIALLMLHLGVAVEMQYGTAASGGSGAYVISSTSPSLYCSEYAYKAFFRYDSTTLHGYARTDYSDSAWMAMMKADLDLGHPMQYDGQGKGGGHTWVCDGYDASGLFHMNWGWSGSDNGYFTLSALNPGTLGTGGGDGDFNAGQECIFGIQPLAPFTSGKPFGFALADSVRITTNPVALGLPFVVTAKITNKNSTDFSGSISARVFDKVGAHVADVQVLTNQSVAAGGTSGTLTFTTTGLSLVPGQYTIGIYASDNNRDWTIASAGGFADPISLTITPLLGGGLRLSTAIQVASTNWIRGSATSVAVNIQNNTLLTFAGDIRADLKDLDGNFIENVGVHHETLGLAAGASYPNPLTFSLDSVTAAPGTYSLAVSSISLTGDTLLCGGDLFSNPISVTVVVPALLPDKYEPNNSEDSAYVFNPVFTNDTAMISTDGANLQFGTQNDYYKVVFPAGYTYTITTSIHDSYTDPSLFSVDAGVTIADTGDWSDTYDGDVPTPNVLVNGGTLTYLVAPWNEGGTGTYDLVMNASRTPLGVTLGIPNGSSLSLYPNPASSSVAVVSNGSAVQLNSLEIINLLGQTVKQLSQKELLANHMRLNVSDLMSGVYFVRIGTASIVSTLKLAIERN